MNLKITLLPKTIQRLAKRPLGEKETEKRVRKAFAIVYGDRSVEDVVAEIIDNTVWEATQPTKGE